MNATTHGFKDESKPSGEENFLRVIKDKPEIIIQAPDYGKPAEGQFLMPDKVTMPDEHLDKRSMAMLERANAFICKSPDDYKRGDQVVSECAALIKAIKGIHDPICKATNAAHKAATGGRKKLIDPIEAASKVIDTRLGNFKMAYDRKIAAENKALEDKARKEQEEAALTQATQMEEEGAPEEIVKAVLETAHEPAAAMKSETPVLSSSNSRTPDWDIEILDKKLVPDYYKTVNEGTIRTDVRSRKGNITIPGVRIIDTFKTRRNAL